MIYKTDAASEHQPDERCAIDYNDPKFVAYHDNEWGLPTFDDQHFFEKVCLEGFQVGLSWKTILHRRDGFRAAFESFDAEKLAAFTDADIKRLLHNTQIIRNRQKILSVINNARRMLELREEPGSLAALCWSFKPETARRPTRLTQQWLSENPSTVESTALAKALKNRGWSYVGPVNMYALMQALGIVNDHVHGCPRRVAIETLNRHS